ncbi:lipid-binding SYLF domain-containing protein [Candidatus Binatia bacterium]|nr:lipid-binding SYLF domain-containing protein [Candidatus Binatia bacterium]
MRTRIAVLGFVLLFGAIAIPSRTAGAASASAIDTEVTAALKILYASDPAAKTLGQKAKAILVFPSVWKAGFMIGGQGGNGALRKGNKTIGYYNTAAVSYGFQAGAQQFGYALFFMTESALDHLDQSGGWEIGTGPSVVVVDAGMAKSLTTTSIQHDIYAFIFNQKGLMGGVGIQGSKITRIRPGK